MDTGHARPRNCARGGQAHTSWIGLDPWSVDANWTEAAFDEWLPCAITSPNRRTKMCDADTVAELYSRQCDGGPKRNCANVRKLGVGGLFMLEQACLHPVVEQLLGYCGHQDLTALHMASQKWKVLVEAACPVSLLKTRAKLWEQREVVRPIWMDTDCNCSWYVNRTDSRDTSSQCIAATSLALHHITIYPRVVLFVKTMTGKILQFSIRSISGRPVMPMLSVGMLHVRYSHIDGPKPDQIDFIFNGRVLDHMRASLAVHAFSPSCVSGERCASDTKVKDRAVNGT
jgi:hypothetical protein